LVQALERRPQSPQSRLLCAQAWLGVRLWRAHGLANANWAIGTHRARTKGPWSPGQFRHGAARESRCDLRSGAIANMPG
jgi:hypothetical protein